MKIFVEYDSVGTILAVGVSMNADPGAGRMKLAARPGCHAIELEAPHVKHERDYDQLRSIKREHRVELHSHGHRLIRIDSRSGD